MEQDLEQTLRALAKKWDTQAIGIMCSKDTTVYQEGMADGLERAARDLIRILGRL